MTAGVPDLRRVLLPAIAATVCVVAALRPPEVSHVASGLVEALAAAALLLLVARGWRPSSDAGCAVLWTLPLAAAAVLLAPDRAGAVDEAAQVGVFVVCVALGAAAARDHRTRRVLPALLAVLGTAVAAQAIVQHQWAWPRAAAEMRALGPPPDSMADAILVRLESGRPSGPFALPAALAGFLALTLPASVLVTTRARSAARAAAGAAVLAQAYALFLTRSLGGLAAVTCGLVVLVWGAQNVGGRRTIAVLLVTLTAVVSIVFLYARHDEITAAPGADPLSLRAGNWGAAAAMIRDHPLLGVGPGAFATFYPRYMREGMNETRFAHDSYLQVMSTWGSWVVLPIALGLATLLRRAHRLRALEPYRLAALAGGVSFLVHNLIDFTFYLPGVAIPAAVLLGAGTAAAAAESAAAAEPAAADDPVRRPDVAGTVRRRAGLWMIPACAAAALLAGHGLVASRCGLLLEEAGADVSAGAIDAALLAARRATAMRPSDPAPWAFVSELILANRRGDPAAMREGEAAAALAVRLDPESAVRHHVRALYHAAAGETAAAWLEERRAHDLFPLKALYHDAAPAETGS